VIEKILKTFGPTNSDRDKTARSWSFLRPMISISISVTVIVLAIVYGPRIENFLDSASDHTLLILILVVTILTRHRR